MDIEYVRSRFIKHFDGTTGAVYASPGRINLIGEHCIPRSNRQRHDCRSKAEWNKHCQSLFH